jgi:hypothetical protein
MTFPALVHFSRGEFHFPDQMDIPFLRWLDRVRERANVPFVITDDGRPTGQMPEGASVTSLHKRGRAVDIRSRDWTSAQYWQVVGAIIFLAAAAPGKVELELVHGPTDQHLHVGVDDNPKAVPQLILASE